jgi:hypothetical protein
VFCTEERDIYITEYVCVVFGGLGIPCFNDLVAPEESRVRAFLVVRSWGITVSNLVARS